jgi:ABC-type Na+ efflux pump permease subunit
MLMFLAVFVGASPLLQSVLEEKMARIAEVLLGSVTPFELIMGKLLGTVGVSLTMVSVYLAGAYYALWHLGYAELFPTHLLVWFLVFMSLAVLMYGSLFSAIGAAVTDMKEAQSAMMPVILLAMFPMFIWLNVVRSPTATFSQVASLFPPATPMLMLMRQAVPPGVPLWEPILGVLLVLLTTVACVFAAGRVFRIGILMHGKGANVMQMLKWAIRG